jgi:hypothetical protein
MKGWKDGRIGRQVMTRLSHDIHEAYLLAHDWNDVCGVPSSSRTGGLAFLESLLSFEALSRVSSYHI